MRPTWRLTLGIVFTEDCASIRTGLTPWFTRIWFQIGIFYVAFATVGCWAWLLKSFLLGFPQGQFFKWLANIHSHIFTTRSVGFYWLFCRRLGIPLWPLDGAGRAAGRVEQRQRRRWCEFLVWCSWHKSFCRYCWLWRRRRPGERDPAAAGWLLWYRRTRGSQRRATSSGRHGGGGILWRVAGFKTMARNSIRPISNL